jgi:hypothetical protein
VTVAAAHCSLEEETLLRDSLQLLDGAGRCLQHTATGMESSQHGSGERRAAIALEEVVERLESCSSVVEGDSGWSGAR